MLVHDSRSTSSSTANRPVHQLTAITNQPTGKVGFRRQPDTLAPSCQRQWLATLLSHTAAEAGQVAQRRQLLDGHRQLLDPHQCVYSLETGQRDTHTRDRCTYIHLHICIDTDGLHIIEKGYHCCRHCVSRSAVMVAFKCSSSSALPPLEISCSGTASSEPMTIAIDGLKVFQCSRLIRKPTD